MARVETIVPANNPAFGLVSLLPSEIQLDPETLKARPGPEPDHEDQQIEALAKSMSEIGQIVPLVVEARDSVFWLVDGRRRHQAAQSLKGFRLQCVIRDKYSGVTALQTAIHANLKRRGYTPVQFANICEEVRKANSWTGTKEVAEYLGVSRAQVSQHDKLLTQPDGMDDKTYQDLIGKVASGKMGADAAFFTLTHVEPAKADKVLPRATALAAKEAAAKAGVSATKASASSKAQDKASRPKPLGPKPTAAERKAFAAANKEQLKKHKERVAAEKKAKATAKAEAGAKAKVTKKHVEQAAREERAIKTDLQRSIPDLRTLLQKLSTTAYPDVMRNFATQIDAWTRGDATDRELLTQWSQIAQLCEAQLEKTRNGSVKSKAAVKKSKQKNVKRVAKAKQKK